LIRESPVRLYAPDHPELANTAAARVLNERERVAANLAGGCAENHAEYRWNVGFIAGLEFCLEALRTVDRELREQRN
jgi:hypothetical protein